VGVESQLLKGRSTRTSSACQTYRSSLLSHPHPSETVSAAYTTKCQDMQQRFRKLQQLMLLLMWSCCWRLSRCLGPWVPAWRWDNTQIVHNVRL
jgi:hypothetical protein